VTVDHTDHRGNNDVKNARHPCEGRKAIREDPNKELEIVTQIIPRFVGPATVLRTLQSFRLAARHGSWRMKPHSTRHTDTQQTSGTGGDHQGDLQHREAETEIRVFRLKSRARTDVASYYPCLRQQHFRQQHPVARFRVPAVVARAADRSRPGFWVVLAAARVPWRRLPSTNNIHDPHQKCYQVTAVAGSRSGGQYRDRSEGHEWRRDRRQMRVSMCPSHRDHKVYVFHMTTPTRTGCVRYWYGHFFRTTALHSAASAFHRRPRAPAARRHHSRPPVRPPAQGIPALAAARSRRDVAQF